MLEAARAVAFLHSQDPPVVHADIKSLNFLLDESGVLKLADFGGARLLESASQEEPGPGSKSRGSLDERTECFEGWCGGECLVRDLEGGSTGSAASMEPYAHLLRRDAWEEEAVFTTQWAAPELLASMDPVNGWVDPYERRASFATSPRPSRKGSATSLGSAMATRVMSQGVGATTPASSRESSCHTAGGWDDLLLDGMPSQGATHFHPDCRSDVYALAMVIWELATGEVPYESLTNSQMRDHILIAERLPIPQGLPGVLVGLIQRGWAHDPGERPPAEEFVRVIEGLVLRGEQEGQRESSMATCPESFAGDRQESPRRKNKADRKPPGASL